MLRGHLDDVLERLARGVQLARRAAWGHVHASDAPILGVALPELAGPAGEVGERHRRGVRRRVLAKLLNLRRDLLIVGGGEIRTLVWGRGGGLGVERGGEILANGPGIFLLGRDESLEVLDHLGHRLEPSCAVGGDERLAVFALALATFRANAPLHVPAVADVHVGQFAVFGAASAKDVELVGDAFLRRGHGARLLLFVLVAVRVIVAVLTGRRGLRGSDELLLLGVVRFLVLVVLLVVVLVVDPLGSAELDGRRRGLGDERLGLLGLPTAAARGHDRRWVLGRGLGFVAGRRRRGRGILLLFDESPSLGLGAWRRPQLGVHSLDVDGGAREASIDRLDVGVRLLLPESGDGFAHAAESPPARRVEPRSALRLLPAGLLDGDGPSVGEGEAGLVVYALGEIREAFGLLGGEIRLRGLGATHPEDSAKGFPRGREHLREEVGSGRARARLDLVGEEDPPLGSFGRRGDAVRADERRLGATVGARLPGVSRRSAPARGGAFVPGEGRGGDAAAPAAAAHRAVGGRVQRVIVLHRDRSAHNRAPIRLTRRAQ